MNTTGARIRRAREDKGLKQGELAKKIGVSNVTISNWESDTHHLRAENAAKLAEALGVHVNYLLDGKLPEAIIGEQIIAWDNERSPINDEIVIPFFQRNDSSLNSGELGVANRAQQPILTRQALSAYGVDVENAVSAIVLGKNLEPNIPEGATICIDKGDTEIKNGRIYAFYYGGITCIKILYNLPKGGLRLANYNKEEYPDEVITAEERAEIEIIGRVFNFSVNLP